MAQKGLSIFLAGMGVGVAAAMVVMDDGLRTRLGKGLRAGSQRVTDAVSDPQAAWDAVRNTVVPGPGLSPSSAVCRTVTAVLAPPLSASGA